MGICSSHKVSVSVTQFQKTNLVRVMKKKTAVAPASDGQSSPLNVVWAPNNGSIPDSNASIPDKVSSLENVSVETLSMDIRNHMLWLIRIIHCQNLQSRLSGVGEIPQILKFTIMVSNVHESLTLLNYNPLDVS